MYTFDDRDGSSLTLRPEATAGIVRAVIEHNLMNTDPALKVYALGPMFRRERPQKGRYRQFHQVDVEAFGIDGAVHRRRDHRDGARLSRGLAGSAQWELVLNSVGDAKCRPAYVETLRDALRANAARLCADCQRRTETNPLRVLDCKVPEDQPIIEALPRIADHLCAECRDHFAEVRRELDLLGIPTASSHRLVRGLDYYMRTTFEVMSGALGAQNSVLGGGRYDGLVKDLGGPDLPGIGFALGMERLVMTMPAGGRGAALRRVPGPARRGRRSTTPCACSATLRDAGVQRAHGPRGPRPQVADEARGQAGRALRGHPGRGRAGRAAVDGAGHGGLEPGDT